MRHLVLLVTKTYQPTVMTYHDSTPAFFCHGEERPSNIVFVCDHASNRVPYCINNGNLGLDARDMERHIAYDIGAAGVTRHLADAFDAPAILSNYSRLVIDPNRGEDDPTLLMRLYDGTLIPANRNADVHERERRLNAFHRPYHQAVEAILSKREQPIVISIHSFTPQLKGRDPRPWQIAVLYADDDRLSRHVLDRLALETDLCIGDNQPYTGRLGGDSMDQHALQHGRHHTLFEIRNDLIATPEGQQAWANQLVPVLQDAIAKIQP